eukprot:1145313-Pelagomonas_calceolata.AAC.3
MEFSVECECGAVASCGRLTLGLQAHSLLKILGPKQAAQASTCTLDLEPTQGVREITRGPQSGILLH